MLFLVGLVNAIHLLKRQEADRRQREEIGKTVPLLNFVNRMLLILISPPSLGQQNTFVARIRQDSASSQLNAYYTSSINGSFLT